MLATTRVTGLLLLLAAAWGGVVAYVGPTFDFDLGNTTRAWVWNQNHWTLHAAPALVGIVGGALLMVGTPWALGRLGAVLGLVSGAWFVVGPTLEPLWHSSGAGTSGLIGPSGSMLHRVLEGIGYHYGTGVVIVMLASFALGLLAFAPRAVAAARPVEAQPEPRPSFGRARPA